MNVVMIGTGYVGLVTGIGYAMLGHSVTCVDTDNAKIFELLAGRVPFFEEGLAEQLVLLQSERVLKFTTDLSEVLPFADIVMIAVGTPALPTGEADITAVEHVIETLGRSLEHPVLVCIKSTVPVGTNTRLEQRLQALLLEQEKSSWSTNVRVASVPEFLREGTALQDFLRPDRLVFGARDRVVFDLLKTLHTGIEAPVFEMSHESAELTKLAANAFLATKISFINEIAQVAQRTSASVLDVSVAMGADKRIGSASLKAGVGYGGSCFPKDVLALQSIAAKHQYEFRLLSSVLSVNNEQRQAFVRMIERELHGVRGRQIAVWGLSYKGGTDDIRDSSAIEIVRQLCGLGAEVVAFDPKAMGRAEQVLPATVVFASTAVDATIGADAVILLTDWPLFREISFETVATSMAQLYFFDGRNYCADLKLSQYGFTYTGIGIPQESPQ